MKKRKNITKGILFAYAILLGLFLSTTAQAQDCGCNHVIEVNTTFVDGKQLGIKPGDVVCLKAGKRTNLLFKNVVGSSSNPVTIKNCGGQVVLGGSTINNGILFQNSRYFKLTGTGSSSYEYGIKIDKTKAGSQGVAVTEFSSDVEIDHLEIIGAGFAGIMAKTDPKCDGSADRGKFTMYNVKIHDNYIHDLTGEGIYLGNSFYNGTTVYCNKTQYPHDVKGVRVYNNIIKNTGWEGIQVGSASHDVEIYDNQVYNYGQANRDSQNNGIQLGLGTTGKCYNNYIENGYGNGIVIQGIGNNLVYNNVIVGAGYPAFNVNVRPTPLSSDVVSKGFLGGVYIINNTIIDSKNKGAINEYVNAAPNNVFYNNFIVSGNSNFSQLKTYTSWKLEKNILVKDISSAKFVNPSAKDYRIQQGSPAIEAGKDVASYGISLDWDRKGRKVGNATDAGICEYSGSTTSIAPPPPLNVNPKVSAGADQTITLPTNTATFTGSASDEDGTIASYTWTKVSGPSASMSGANSNKLSLSGLVAGTYTFKLTVKDNQGASASNDAILTVKAAPVVEETSAPAPAPEEPAPAPTTNGPVVYAGSDKTFTLPKNSTTLTFSGKTSGQWRSFKWTKQSGPSVSMSGENTANCNISNLVKGTYIFRVTATDSNGGSGWDELKITVLGSGETETPTEPTPTPTTNQIPVAMAGSDKTITLPTNTITVSGSGSDKDGSISSYAWTKTSGPSATLSGANTAALKVSNMLEGIYTFRLTVKDNAGASASDEVKITVNKAPVSTEPAQASAPTTASGPIYRINAGGNAVSSSPIQWGTDTKEKPSQYLSSSSSNNVAGASSWNKTNNTSAPNSVLATMRFDYSWGGAMKYNLPVKNGSYEVRLYFAETPYAGGVTAANKRVFDVNFEGQTKVSGLDIYKEVGMNALQKTIIVNVTDGTLNIDFIRRIGNPQVNGIEVLPASSSNTMSLSKENKLNDFTTFTEQKLTVFPNPVEDQVNIRFAQEVQASAEVQILDLEGRSLLNNSIQNAVGTTETSFDISYLNLPAGVYLLKVQVDGQEAEMLRIIKH